MLNPNQSSSQMIKAVVTLVGGLIVLGVFIVILGGHRFWEDLKSYQIRFLSVQDLNTGAPVKYAGLTIGRVEQIQVDPRDPSRITVYIGIEEDFKIYGGTVARISQKGLVGDNYVLLEMVEEPGPELKPGSEIPSRGQMTMGEVVDKVGMTLEDLGPRLDRIAAGLEGLVGPDNQEALSRILNETPELLAQLKGTLVNVEEDLDLLTRSISTELASGNQSFMDLSRSFQDSVSRVEQDFNTLASSVSKAGDSINGLADRMNRELEINQEEIEELLMGLNELTRELQLFSRTIRERPWQIIYAPEKQ